MPGSPWDEWAGHHGTVFGLTTRADEQMLAAWCDLFSRAGYRSEELRRATDWLAAHQAPRYRSEHLALLQERVRDQRAAECRQQPADDGDRGNCTLCDGSGRVIVPSPQALGQGRWGTQAVLCRCPLGRWFLERLGSRNPLTLDAYERQMPDWRRLLEEHRQAQRDSRAEAEIRARLSWHQDLQKQAEVVTLEVDRILGAILGRRSGSGSNTA